MLVEFVSEANECILCTDVKDKVDLDVSETECILCTDVKDECGVGIEPVCSNNHSFHLSCVKKQFKPECPLCRETLDIETTGELTYRDMYVPISDHDSYDSYASASARCYTGDREQDMLIDAEIVDMCDTLDEISDELYSLFTPNYLRLKLLIRQLRCSFDQDDFDEAVQLNEDFKYYIDLGN